MSDIITPQSKKVSFATDGVNRSEVMQSFSDAAIEDITTLASGHNDNVHTINEVSNTVLQEMAHVKTSIASLKNKQEFRERNATTLVHTVDLRSKDGFTYALDSSPIDRLVLDQRHGQIYLAPTASTPLFFGETDIGGVIPNNNLAVRVTSISEGLSGNFAASISPGNVKNAFNGYNNSYWVRRVEYPLEAPVTEVVMEVVVDVPTNASGTFNTLAVAPHPLGRVDIMGVWYKETTAAPWTILEEFPQELVSSTTTYIPIPIVESSNQQWSGNVRPARSFKIQFRQRDWIVENNKKVFIYGAQEISARLVQYNTKASILPLSVKDNAHIIYKVTAPEATKFGSISSILIGPNPKSEGSNIEDNHLTYHFTTKIPTVAAPVISSGDIFWTSYSSALPQNVEPLVLAGGLTEYYIMISMKYVSKTTKDNSVFSAGTTPVVDYINLVHSLEPLESLDAAVAAIDWTGRNTQAHFSSMMMMDAYRGAVEDGSNMFIMWDDMWEDSTWRTSLESSVNNVKIDKEYMALTTDSSGISASGSVTYLAHSSSDWGDFNPSRYRLQVASDMPAGSSISFTLNYELATTGGHTVSVLPTDVRNSKGSLPWMDIPNALDTNDELIAISLTIDIANGGIGVVPKLYQFALMVKD